MKNTCQFYHYNSEEYNIELNNPDHFAENFTYGELCSKSVNWLNFHNIEDVESIKKLCDNFNIDKITTEDIFRDIKPKLEEYSYYLFFTIKSATFDKSGIKKNKITFILGSNFLISFQSKKLDHFDDVRDRIINDRGRIRQKFSDYLLYRLLSCLIDNYLETLWVINKDVNQIELELNKDSKFDFSKLELQKRKLLELKKIVTPFKNILTHLENMNTNLIEPENRRFFHELYDNVCDILDEIDDTKQIIDGVSNLYYSIQGQKMNEIMKLLTIISTIFIPLTFLAGIYGMNFENLPELKWKWGYFIFWIIIVGIASLLILLFKRKKWL